MQVLSTKFEGVKIIEPRVHGDARGFFMESYNFAMFKELGIDVAFVQDNHSLSAEAGTIRGLHYQLNPFAQTKLVRVISGSIYDVVVDIRLGSPTYGHWEAFILNDDNKRQVLVPHGFAHGFCTLEPNTQVVYKVDNYYSPTHDRGIRWNDPELGIDWPTQQPILSQKDQEHPSLKMAENNFVF